MHEVSLVEALFDQVDGAIAPHAPGDVRAITLRVGALAGVEVALLRTAFDGCRGLRGYTAAALTVVDEAARWRCGACGAPVDEARGLRCEGCGGAPTLAGGDALVLERIELEVPDV